MQHEWKGQKELVAAQPQHSSSVHRCCSSRTRACRSCSWRSVHTKPAVLPGPHMLPASLHPHRLCSGLHVGFLIRHLYWREICWNFVERGSILHSHIDTATTHVASLPSDKVHLKKTAAPCDCCPAALSPLNPCSAAKTLPPSRVSTAGSPANACAHSCTGNRHSLQQQATPPLPAAASPFGRLDICFARYDANTRAGKLLWTGSHWTARKVVHQPTTAHTQAVHAVCGGLLLSLSVDVGSFGCSVAATGRLAVD